MIPNRPQIRGRRAFHPQIAGDLIQFFSFNSIL